MNERIENNGFDGIANASIGIRGSSIGGKNGMTIALVFAFGMNFITCWFSDKIVLKMCRAQQVTQTQEEIIS